MKEKVLLLLGCITATVTCLPLQMNLPGGNTADQNNLSMIKRIQETIEGKSQPAIKNLVATKSEGSKESQETPSEPIHANEATKSEESTVPHGIFSKIIQANKDSDVPMHGGDILVKVGRSAVNCASCLWPKSADGTVIVPYTISSSYSAGDLSTIKNAIQEFLTLTCVRFIPRTTENDYVNIYPDSGCFSYIGRTGGSQPVSLGGGCVYRGIVQHELQHALGFFHEHMRSDRDSYVQIMYQYIAQGKWGNFDKANTNNLGLEYDYGSVMHYDGYAFSNTSNQRSIVTIPDPTVPIGQRNGLSILDVSKINRLYQCNVCASLLNNQNGVFTSANYPSAYANNLNCVWLIRVPSGQASLTFSAFDVQSSADCSSDYMRIYDGPTKNNSVLLDKVCGSRSIPPVIASTSQMLVEFVSDSSVAGVGFKASYSSVQCGGTFFSSPGYFTTPGYPGSYGSNMDCSFTITAPAGLRIALTVSDFHVENAQWCIYDNLKVFADGLQYGPFCGDSYVPKISTKGNSMVVAFHSDQSTELKGFQASYYFF